MSRGKIVPQGIRRRSTSAVRSAVTHRVRRWTLGKVPRKVNNSVVVESDDYQRMVRAFSASTLTGTLVTISTIVDRFKVAGSVARMIIKDLVQRGELRYVLKHGKQMILTSTKLNQR